MSRKGKLYPTATHWGQYLIEAEDDALVRVLNYSDEPEPSPIGQALLDSRNPQCRIMKPMIRKSFRDNKIRDSGFLRGKEPFVPVSWEEALDTASKSLEEAKNAYGNAAIYGGSYGWASAGRFHHSQSQLHRFLNQFGGYTRSDRTYSAAAGEIILPHVLGSDLYTLFLHTTPWKDVAESGELVVCFGGIPEKNLQVVMGGPGAHTHGKQLNDCRTANIRFINISPIKSDVPDYLNAEWIPIKPGTDVALILAICHTLLIHNLYNENFIEKYTVGFEQFREYLLGSSDGQEKTPQWAETITGVSKNSIYSLAKAMASSRCFIPMGWSLQRAEHGEQPFWASTVLIAMLGQFGLPGAGVGHGVGSLSCIGFSGRKILPFSWGTFPQGKNPIDSLIPVARITEMLESPGTKFNYNGRSLTYPDIKLIFWAGGNVFHQHQDLNRLRKAWSKPDCIIVNEQVWTASARHADIVFPITTSLERNDLHFSTFDHYVTPMRQAVPPLGEARSDYDVFTGLAERLGFKDLFTEKKDEMAWIRSIYEYSSKTANKHGIELPDFEKFWNGQHFSIKDQIKEVKLIPELFREDPSKNPLGTPSGKIEIHSQTIANFNYKECPGHPVWIEKDESLNSRRTKNFPLHLISNQPKNKLHSQLDFGSISLKDKVAGREPTMINPKDAADRNIKDGAIIRIFNDRGACLSAAKLSENIRVGVIQLSTGAWYDPIDTGNDLSLDSHGNPNVLTRDRGTSELAQGPTAHSCLVQIEVYSEKVPEVSSFLPPEIAQS